MAGHRMLILSCSARKRPDMGLLPALERYDGVNFRVLRKAKREGYCPRNLEILILSTKHGLLEPHTPIEDYDLRMTPRRAAELRPVVHGVLSERTRVGSYAEVFLNVGSVYLGAFEDWMIPSRQDLNVIVASGGIGHKASQMRSWLLEKARSQL